MTTVVVGRMEASPAGRWGRVLRGGGFIVAFVVLWELLSRWHVLTPEFASSPARVGLALWDLVSDPQFWSVHVRATAEGFAAGWVLAVAVGVGLGVLMGWYGVARDLFEPLIMAFYSTPRIALIPLFIVWFGFEFRYKVVVVFLSAVFPIIMNTIAGVRDCDAQLVRMSRSFCASDRQVLAMVVLPGAVPSIVTGLRQGMTHAVVGAVVGEIFSSGSGLGFLINQSAQLYQTDRLLATVMLLGAAGVGLNEVLVRMQNRMLRWRSAAP